jgi:aconitate hydratase
VWPSGAEIDAALAVAAETEGYDAAYRDAEASANWRELSASSDSLFRWNDASTYIRRPPLAGGGVGSGSRLGSYTAHPLLVAGDDITTSLRLAKFRGIVKQPPISSPAVTTVTI